MRNYRRRVVIFEQPFETTFGGNFFFFSFHLSKTMEKKKRRDRRKA